MSEDLEIRGGVGGIAARLDDLERVARLLRSVAAQLAGLGRRLAGVQGRLEFQPGWMLSGVLSPGTFAGAQVALVLALTGPSGLVVASGRAEALGVALRLVVAGYRRAESAVAMSFHGAELAVGRLLGAALLTEPGVVGAVVLGGLAVLAGRQIDQGFSWGRLGAGAAGELSAHTRVVQVAAGVMPGLLEQRDTAGVASVIAEVGALVSGGAEANAVPWFRDSARVRVRVRAAPWTGPPEGVGGLVARIPSSLTPVPVVHIERYDDGEGRRRWLVALPGTADWSPEPGRTPFDLTGDVRVMAGDATAGTVGVVRAMRAVGVRPGEPVLLEGHSQGGIIAARLAADRRVRAEFDIRRVITTGSPIGEVAIPPSVAVLSIEHHDDVVPQLEGRANPATPSWVTVTAPTPPSVLHPPGVSPPPLAAHALTGYQETATALDSSAAPSLVAWQRSLTGFVPPPVAGAAWDVEITRTGR